MRSLLSFVYSAILMIVICMACFAQIVTPLASAREWPPNQSQSGVDSICWQKRDIPFLMRELRQDDAITRVRAVRALRSFGRDACKAIPALRDLLQDKDVHVRLEAACILLSIDSVEQSKALYVILAVLKDPDRVVRKQCVSQLCSLGKRARSAGPAFVSALSDVDESVQSAAFQALTEIPVDRSEVVLPLLTLLDHSNAQVRKYALHHLGRFGRYTDERVRTGLTRQLTSREEKVRLAASMALFRLRPEDKQIKPSILEGLKSTNWENRMECAAFVLEHVQDHKDEAFASFTLGLKDEREEDTVGMTIWKLCDIAENNDHALAFLDRLIRNKEGDAEVRDLAIAAVRTLGPRAKCVIPTLIRCLPEEYPIGGHAADALGAMKKAAQSAIPSLERAVRRHQYNFLIYLNSYNAALALEDIDPGNAVATQYLLGLLKRRSNSEARIMAVSGFLAINHLPHDVIPELIQRATTDRNGTVRRLSIDALGQASGGERADVVRGLIPALRDPEPLVRKTAAMSLGRFGADSLPASTPIVKLFRDDDFDVRLAAVIAHRKIADRSSSSVKALVKLLGDGKANIREQAVISLGTFGDAASESTQAITRLLTDDDPRVSMAARYALSRIPKR